MGAVAENPHTWTSTYGSLVLSAYDSGTHEGVNEQGLSAHALYLAEEAAFGERNPEVEAIGIMQWVQFYLDNYATVAEAVEAQKTLAFQIEALILPNGYPTLVHVSLSDKSGDSAVIEYIGGEARVYHDRRFTVMTNEPTYDKQIENLKQYRTFGGDKPLPGERTPSDRFVRAAYYANGLPEPADADEGAAFIFSVIRNVSVPFGLEDPDRPNVASTIFRTVQDLTGGRYYFESTYAPNVVGVDTTALDFTAGRPEMELQVEKKILSLSGDVTSHLEPAEPFVFGRNEAQNSTALRGRRAVLVRRGRQTSPLQFVDNANKGNATPAAVVACCRRLSVEMQVRGGIPTYALVARLQEPACRVKVRVRIPSSPRRRNAGRSGRLAALPPTPDQQRDDRTDEGADDPAGLDRALPLVEAEEEVAGEAAHEGADDAEQHGLPPAHRITPRYQEPGQVPHDPAHDQQVDDGPEVEHHPSSSSEGSGKASLSRGPEAGAEGLGATGGSDLAHASDQLDLDRDAEGELGESDGAARVTAGIAEHSSPANPRSPSAPSLQRCQDPVAV